MGKTHPLCAKGETFVKREPRSLLTRPLALLLAAALAAGPLPLPVLAAETQPTAAVQPATPETAAAAEETEPPAPQAAETETAEPPAAPAPETTATPENAQPALMTLAEAAPLSGETEPAAGGTITIAGIEYEVDRVATADRNGALTLTNGKAARGALVLADGIEYAGGKYDVTELAANAFSGNTVLTSLDMSASSVKTIGQSCFRDCTALSGVQFSANNVTNMQKSGVFSGCTSLTRLSIPSLNLSSKSNNSPFAGSSIQELTVYNLSSTGIKANLLNNMPDGFTLDLLADISSTALVNTTFGATENVTLNLLVQEDVDHYKTVFKDKDVTVQLYGSSGQEVLANVTDGTGASTGYATLAEAIAAINASSDNGPFTIDILDNGTVEWGDAAPNKATTVDFGGASVNLPATLTLQAPLTIQNITNINSDTDTLTTLVAGEHAFAMIDGGSFGFAEIRGSDLTFEGTLPGGQFGGGQDSRQVQLTGTGDGATVTFVDVGSSDYYYVLPNMAGFAELVLDGAYLEADATEAYSNQLDGAKAVTLNGGGLTVNKSAEIETISGNGELRVAEGAALTVTGSASGSFTLPEVTGTELSSEVLSLPAGSKITLTNQAGESVTITEPVVEDPAVTVTGGNLGSQGCATLADALAAMEADAGDSYTLTLLCDQTLAADTTLPDAALTINGGGYRLTQAEGDALTVQNDLTFQNIQLALAGSITYARAASGEKAITFAETASGSVGSITDNSGSRWLDIVFISDGVTFGKVTGTVSSIGTRLTDLILTGFGTQDTPIDLTGKLENIAGLELNNSWVRASGDATCLGTIRTDCNKVEGQPRTGGLVLTGDTTVHALSVTSNEDFEVWMDADATLTVEESYKRTNQQVPLYTAETPADGHILVKAPRNGNKKMPDYALVSAPEGVTLYWDAEALAYEVSYAPAIAMAEEAEMYKDAYTRPVLTLTDAQGIASISINGSERFTYEEGSPWLTVTPEADWLAQGENTVTATDVSGLTASFTFRYDAPADYGKVDEALGKIPADLSGYTAASVQALEAARDAVVEGVGSSDQALVDKMAQDILDAIAALEPVPSTDPDQPADPDRPADDQPADGNGANNSDNTSHTANSSQTANGQAASASGGAVQPVQAAAAVIPQTADAAMPALWALLAAAALGGATVLTLLRRKHGQ